MTRTRRLAAAYIALAALKIAAQTVYGSAKMILESDEHPWSLIDSVCSPGGTTIEGVVSLQSDGFEKAVFNAVCAVFQDNRRSHRA